jgi:glycosyltransferase involved in cell wall biosynthesis
VSQLISVVICSHNYGRFLGQCLSSVLTQTRVPHEVLLVDDGSDDETAELVACFPGVTYVRQARAGKAAAFNTGFAAARGDVICHLDADDYWAPWKMERILPLLEAHPAAGGVVHDVASVSADGPPLADTPASGPPVLGSLTDLLLSAFSLPGRYRKLGGSANTIAVRRAAVADFFPLPQELGLAVDGALLTLAALDGLLYLPQPLAAYRFHGANNYGPRAMDGQFYLYPWLLSHPRFLARAARDDRELLAAKMFEERLRLSLAVGQAPFPHSGLLCLALARLVVLDGLVNKLKRRDRMMGGPVSNLYDFLKRQRMSLCSKPISERG